MGTISVYFINIKAMGKFKFSLINKVTSINYNTIRI